MESLAALSLACNVVQVIQFCLHSAHVCKQILEDKWPATNIEEDCKYLEILSGQIQASITSASGGGNVQQTSSSTIMSVADRELFAIAKKLTPIAKELQTELVRCRPQATNSRGKKMWKGFKYQVNGKKKIDELHVLLKGFENTMQSFILVDLRYVLGYLKLTFIICSLQQRQGGKDRHNTLRNARPANPSFFCAARIWRKQNRPSCPRSKRRSASSSSRSY